MYKKRFNSYKRELDSHKQQLDILKLLIQQLITRHLTVINSDLTAGNTFCQQLEVAIRHS